MATLYSDVYDFFILKVTAYGLLKLVTADREELLNGYLDLARAKFYKKCTTDLTDIDNVLKTFNTTLELDEIDILSEFMVSCWLQPQIHSDELLESRLNTKDFSEYSPAKLIEQIKSVYYTSSKNAVILMKNYTYSHGDVGDVNA